MYDVCVYSAVGRVLSARCVCGKNRSGKRHASFIPENYGIFRKTVRIVFRRIEFSRARRSAVDIGPSLGDLVTALLYYRLRPPRDT